MEIRRFFVNAKDISDGVITLRGDEFLHMTKVLRYKVGYKAVICANDGCEYDCTVSRIDKDFALLSIEGKTEVDRKDISLTLYAGLLKNNKLDLVVQKAVELGVDKVVPFTSANCAETKFAVDRANKIALEAAKQCGSAYLSEVGDLITYDEVIKELCSYDDVVIAYEFERERRIADVKVKGKRIALIVGPEGGFKKSEVEDAIASGAQTVTLGRRILRAETASIVATALLLDNLGELNY